MSDAVSALNGAQHSGEVTVTEAGLRGMVTLRGDLSDATLASAVKDVTGCDLPSLRGIIDGDDHAVFWMSPDELLLILPYDAAPGATQQLSAALAGTHHLVADVSDARAVFRVEGPFAREVLAKLTPADVSPAALPPGELRRTRLAQAAAAIRMLDETRAEVVCFRSVAEYMFNLLANAARNGPVGHF